MLHAKPVSAVPVPRPVNARSWPASIRTELLDAEAQINEVYCRANASLVKYSKAGKFRVISDEEIPRFHPDFSARKVAQAMEIEEVLA